MSSRYSEYPRSEYPESPEGPRSNAPGAPEEPAAAREDEPNEDGARRKRVEHVLRDFIKRGVEKGIEAGLGTISKSQETLKNISDLGVPREVAGYVFSQIDETKNALVRVVGREVREFLEATDLSNEIRNALTSLSFQINTEIRFVPNEQGVPKPEVKTKVRPRRTEPPAAPPSSTNGE